MKTALQVYEAMPSSINTDADNFVSKGAIPNIMKTCVGVHFPVFNNSTEETWKRNITPLYEEDLSASWFMCHVERLYAIHMLEHASEQAVTVAMSLMPHRFRIPKGASMRQGGL